MSIIKAMMRQQPYAIIYARGVNRHREAIDAKYDRLIREAIEEQLQFEPNSGNEEPQAAPTASSIRGAMGNSFRSG